MPLICENLEFGSMAVFSLKFVPDRFCD